MRTDELAVLKRENVGGGIRQDSKEKHSWERERDGAESQKSKRDWESEADDQGHEHQALARWGEEQSV